MTQMQWNKNRLLIVVVVTVTFLAALTASVAAQPVQIKVWDALGATGRDVYLEVVEDFKAAHPEISVEVELVPGGYQGIREKFTVALLGGVAPNVVHQAHVQAYSFRYQNVFMPLNNYIAEDPTFNMADWYPPFLETVTLNDMIYGIPYNLSTPLMYYVPRAFEEAGLAPNPPATWNDMLLLGRRITRDVSGDGNNKIWATDNVRSPGWVMEAYLGQAGGRAVNADKTELTLNSPAGIKAWEFQQSLIHQEGISRYPGATAAELESGRVAWWIRSTASLRSRMETNTAAGTPTKVAPLACDVNCYAPIGGGAFYAVDTGTQAQRDATYEFLRFIAEPENLARYAAASGYMAGRRSSLNTKPLRAAFAEYPQFMVTYEQLAVAHPETQAPEWGDIQKMWEDRPTFLDPIFQNNAPVKAVLDDLVRRGNALYKEFYARNGAPK